MVSDRECFQQCLVWWIAVFHVPVASFTYKYPSTEKRIPLFMCSISQKEVFFVNFSLVSLPLQRDPLSLDSSPHYNIFIDIKLINLSR